MPTKKKAFILTTSLLLSSLITTSILAQTKRSETEATKRGREIAEEADRRDEGWGTSSSTLTMTLRNRHGQKSTRSLRQRVLETKTEGEGDKSLVLFDEPRDVEGTALLSHTKILEADSQWLYLPALKRVKRISSANKSGSFVGSEFAYEDLLSQEVEKYAYTYLRDEPCGELSCAVVERIPLYENSGYSKQISWTDLKEYRIQKVEFYDRKDSLLKILTYEGYKQYAEKYWRVDKLHMKNQQNGKQTELLISEWKIGTGLKESDFTSSRLKMVK